MRSEKVKHIGILRIIALLIPLKHRLNFLILKYLNSSSILNIPYCDGYDILVSVNLQNKTTISDLIFEGPRYLPEFKLVTDIQSSIPPDYVYVDVGSNIGTTVWLFARRAKKVICFEPIPQLNNVIRQSIDANKAQNVLLIDKAIGNTEGEIVMLDNNNSSIVEPGVKERVVKSRISTLDLVLVAEAKIDLIKIDVEGFEFNVLEGALQTIKKHRPRLLIELHPGFILNYGNNYVDVISFVENLSYTISYYSFLDDLTISRWRRISSRWLPNKGKRFLTKEDLGEYIMKNKNISSYHLFCEPS